jgi:predicted small secreted protein
MKKALVAVLFISFVSVLASSCASTRNGAGKGCPTTNPRYFRA